MTGNVQNSTAGNKTLTLQGVIVNNPDIVLAVMDLKMPVMDGFKAVEEIKKFRPQLPVIAETAYACQADVDKAFNAGCDDYITKPVKRSILLEKIVGLLSKADSK